MKSEASLSDEWVTPPWLFRARHERFAFQLDAAATRENRKCELFQSKRVNALKHAWGGRVWLNPPYSRGNLLAFLGHARGEVLAGHAELVDCLVPAYTCERWWHEHVEAPAGRLLELGHRAEWIGAVYVRRYEHLTIETTFLRRRVRFLYRGAPTAGTSARFSSALITFLDPGCRR